MVAIVLTLAAAALVAGPTLAVKVRAACTQLGIAETELTVPAALVLCNEAMGIDASGPLLAQADELVNQLGLSFDTLVPQSAPAPPPRQREQPPMPKLVVFDLDFTLWKPELYQLSSGSPFKASSDGCVVTSRSERLDLFPAARTALRQLADAGVPVAIASRASEVAWAQEIMRLLRVDKGRTVADVIGSSPVVIQGGSQVKHLKHIASESGVPLREMLFFDNERTNIAEVEKIGPTCIYCPRGMTDKLFGEGVSVHVANRASTRLAAAASGSGRSRRGSRRENADEDAEVSRPRRKKDRGSKGRRR